MLFKILQTSRGEERKYRNQWRYDGNLFIIDFFGNYQPFLTNGSGFIHQRRFLQN